MSVTLMHHAKATGCKEISFGMDLFPSNIVLDGRGPNGKGKFTVQNNWILISSDVVLQSKVLRHLEDNK